MKYKLFNFLMNQKIQRGNNAFEVFGNPVGVNLPVNYVYRVHWRIISKN